MSNKRIFKVSFVQDDEVFEIYAKSVGESDMFGFLMIEDVLFGEKSQVVVDPFEERLKAEFSDVKRTYIPMHSILRIDEVEKQGAAKVKPTSKDNVSKVTPFAKTLYKPLDENK